MQLEEIVCAAVLFCFILHCLVASNMSILDGNLYVEGILKPSRLLDLHAKKMILYQLQDGYNSSNSSGAPQQCTSQPATPGGVLPVPSPLSPSPASLSSYHGDDSDSISSPPWPPKTPSSPVRRVFMDKRAYFSLFTQPTSYLRIYKYLMIFTGRVNCFAAASSYHLLLSVSSENQPQPIRDQRRANHAALRVWSGAREAELGGAIPELHGGEGHARQPSPRRGQEATGPLEALHLRSGDRRPGHGNVWRAHVMTRANQAHAVRARQPAPVHIGSLAFSGKVQCGIWRACKC